MTHGHERGAGMQGQWEHNWRYDGNGQPFLQLKGRWWRLERQAGSRLLVTFYDTQNKLRPGLAYVYSPPQEWPVDEARIRMRGATARPPAVAVVLYLSRTLYELVVMWPAP